MEEILVNCVLCKKLTNNDKYHFGCSTLWENDLLKICDTCADSIRGISYQEKVDVVERAFGKFTKQSISKISSSALLKSIFAGQLYSYRYIIYKSGAKSKRNLMDQDLMYLLSNDQKDDIFLALREFSDNLKHSDFTFKVLVPEAILYLFAELEGISRNKAEVLLSSYSSQSSYLMQRNGVIENFKLVTLPHALQTDNISCGVFCLKFAENYINGAELALNFPLEDVKEFRKKVVHLLMKRGGETRWQDKLCRICGNERGPSTQQIKKSDKWIKCDN